MRVFRNIICIFLIAGGCAHAQTNEVAKLETVTRNMLDVLYSDAYKHYTYKQQELAIRTILKQNYDVMVIIRRTLGRNWKLLSLEEQTKVQELVTLLVVKAFINGINGMERPIVNYGDLVTITENRFEIPSVVTFPDGKIFNVVYRFGRVKSGWQIYDIIAEDVSIVSNYRQQFDDHFRNGTGAELIEKLEEFLEKDELDESTKL